VVLRAFPSTDTQPHPQHPSGDGFGHPVARCSPSFSFAPVCYNFPRFSYGYVQRVGRGRTSAVVAVSAGSSSRLRTAKVPNYNPRPQMQMANGFRSVPPASFD